MVFRVSKTTPFRSSRRRRSALHRIRLILLLLVLLTCATVWFRTGRDDPRRYDRYRAEIAAASVRHNVDPHLIKAVIMQESDFDSDARGAAGEIGLMQITSGAALDWSRVNRRGAVYRGALFDPGLNIEIGTWYLARALKAWRRHPDGEVLALIQYNAGPGRAKDWSDRMAAEKKSVYAFPIPSTQHYIKGVRRYQRRFREQDGKDR